MERFDLKSETYQIIGICMEVHNLLGHGFSEIVYKDAIELEAAIKGIQADREKEFSIVYKETMLKHKFHADLVMFDNIIVEVKSSAKGIAHEHVMQTLNYMKVSGCDVGLIINFGKKSLEYKRVVF